MQMYTTKMTQNHFLQIRISNKANDMKCETLWKKKENEIKSTRKVLEVKSAGVVHGCRSAKYKGPQMLRREN